MRREEKGEGEEKEGEGEAEWEERRNGGVCRDAGLQPRMVCGVVPIAVSRPLGVVSTQPLGPLKQSWCDYFSYSFRGGYHKHGQRQRCTRQLEELEKKIDDAIQQSKRFDNPNILGDTWIEECNRVIKIIDDAHKNGWVKNDDKFE